jgi:hypothetical protein
MRLLSKLAANHDSGNDSGGVPRVPPDFLSSLVALAHFMRLSSQKAAHADLADAACRKSDSPQRTWDENNGGAAPFQRYWYAGKKLFLKGRIVSAWSESIGKIRFRPMYAGANMGHPSR